MSVLDELKRAEASYRRAQASVERARQERDELLRRALKQHSHAEIATVLGVTRGRVGQLAARAQAGR